MTGDKASPRFGNGEASLERSVSLDNSATQLLEPTESESSISIPVQSPVEVQEEGPGQTLLLESEDLTCLEPATEPAWQGLSLQPQSDDESSGKTEMLSDDDDLVCSVSLCEKERPSSFGSRGDNLCEENILHHNSTSKEYHSNTCPFKESKPGRVGLLASNLHMNLNLNGRQCDGCPEISQQALTEIKGKSECEANTFAENGDDGNKSARDILEPVVVKSSYNRNKASPCFLPTTPKLAVATDLTSRDSPCMSTSKSRSRVIGSVRAESLRAAGLCAAARNRSKGIVGCQKIGNCGSDAAIESCPGTVEPLTAYDKAFAGMSREGEKPKDTSPTSLESPQLNISYKAVNPLPPQSTNDENVGKLRNSCGRNVVTKEVSNLKGWRIRHHAGGRARKLFSDMDETTYKIPESLQDNLTKTEEVSGKLNIRSVRMAGEPLSNYKAGNTDNQGSASSLQARRGGVLECHSSVVPGVAPSSTNLSYVNSQEPGEDSQANALNVVDRLLWLNTTGMSQETEQEKVLEQPDVCCPQSAKGACTLAHVTEVKKLQDQMEIFEWVDSQQDEAMLVSGIETAEGIPASSREKSKSCKVATVTHCKTKFQVCNDKSDLQCLGNGSGNVVGKKESKPQCLGNGSGNVVGKKESKPLSSNKETKVLFCRHVPRHMPTANSNLPVSSSDTFNTNMDIEDNDIRISGTRKTSKPVMISDVPAAKRECNANPNKSIGRRKPKNMKAVKKNMQHLCKKKHTQKGHVGITELANMSIMNSPRLEYQDEEHDQKLQRLENNFQSESLGVSEIGSDTQVAIEAIQMISHCTPLETTVAFDECKENEVMGDEGKKCHNENLSSSKSGMINLKKRNMEQGDSEHVMKRRAQETILEIKNNNFSKNCSRSEDRIRARRARHVNQPSNNRMRAGLDTKRLENIESGLKGKDNDAKPADNTAGTCSDEPGTNKHSSRKRVMCGDKRTKRKAIWIEQNEKSLSPSSTPMLALGLNRRYMTRNLSLSEASEVGMVKTIQREQNDKELSPSSTPMIALGLNRRYVTRNILLREASELGMANEAVKDLKGTEAFPSPSLYRSETVGLKIDAAMDAFKEGNGARIQKGLTRNRITFEGVIPDECQELPHTTLKCGNQDGAKIYNRLLRKPKGRMDASASAISARRISKISSVAVAEQAEYDQQRNAIQSDEDTHFAGQFNVHGQQLFEEMKATGQVKPEKTKASKAGNKKPRDRSDRTLVTHACIFYTEGRRRKREPGSVCVLFSRSLSEDTLRHQKKILAKLGGHVAVSAIECTCFVVDSFVRTRNMLEVMAAGKAVVTTLWLESCGQVCYFVDERKYILEDSKKERELGFSLRLSLEAAEKKPLLKGMKVLVSPNTLPDPESMHAIVVAAGGQIVQSYVTSPKSSASDQNQQFIVISCEDDYDYCLPLLEKGVQVYSTELILSGILLQSLDFSSNLLFKDFGQKLRHSEHSAKFYE